MQLDEYSLVNFVPLDITDNDSLDVLLAHIDMATQYGEDLEPKEPNDNMLGEEDEEDDEGGVPPPEEEEEGDEE